jgi:signal recognition particle receptor subunit beta
MAQLDFQRRELSLKLVYYGPALSGKTTNLSALHERLDPVRRGRLLTLDTAEERTLFFDLLPIAVRTASGLSVKVRLFTVPGQVIHNHTRRVVLQGVDGVAFIADSRVTEIKSNNLSFANLQANLRENRIEPSDVPLVIQFNKRDLPGGRSDDELRRLAKKGAEPIFPAVATRGEGVVETFLGLASATWGQVDEKLSLEARHGLSREEFLTKLARDLGADLSAMPLGGWQ